MTPGRALLSADLALAFILRWIVILGLAALFGLVGFGIVARARRQWTVSGFALLRIVADECELLSLAVAPDERGNGVGALLLESAMEQARAAGAVRQFLEVAEDNTVARRLYDSRGFVPIGRRPDYYRRNDGTLAAAVTMSCDLGGVAAGAEAGA